MWKKLNIASLSLSVCLYKNGHGLVAKDTGNRELPFARGISERRGKERKRKTKKQ